MSTAKVVVSVEIDGVTISQEVPLHVGNPYFHAHEFRKGAAAASEKISDMLIGRFGDLPEAAKERFANNKDYGFPKYLKEA